MQLAGAARSRGARTLLAACTDFLDNYSRLRRSEAIIIADSFRNYKFLGDLPRRDAQRKTVGASEPKGRSSPRRARETERTERASERAKARRGGEKAGTRAGDDRGGCAIRGNVNWGDLLRN